MPVQNIEILNGMIIVYYDNGEVARRKCPELISKSDAYIARFLESIRNEEIQFGTGPDGLTY